MKTNKNIKVTLLIIAMLSISIFLTCIPAIFGYAVQSNGVTTSYMHKDKKLIEEDFFKSQAFDEAVIRPVINLLSRSVYGFDSEIQDSNENKERYIGVRKTAKEELSYLKNIDFIAINNEINEYYSNTEAKNLDEFNEVISKQYYTRQEGESNPKYVDVNISSKNNNIRYKKLLDTKVYERNDLYQTLVALIDLNDLDIHISIPKNLVPGDRIYDTYTSFKQDVFVFNMLKVVSLSSLIVFILATILYKLSKVDVFDKDSVTIKILNFIPIEIRMMTIPIAIYIALLLIDEYIYDMYYNGVYSNSIFYIVCSLIYIFTLFMMIYLYKKQYKSIDNKSDILKQSLILKLFLLIKKIINNINVRTKQNTKNIIKANQKMPLIKRTIILFVIAIIANIIISYIASILWYTFGFLEVITAIILSNMILVFLAYISIKKLSYLSEIIEGTENIKNGNLTYKIELKDNDNFTTLAENINNISEGLENSIDKQLRSERMKSELITNVSHDLKTPLTSIINYIDLIKEEKNIQPEYINDYINVLDSKSKRLKALIEDLFEASKASSGNIELNIECIEFKQLLRQAIAEMEEKLLNANLDIKLNMPEEKVYINADGKRLYRVLENILSNISKYSLSNTRVYIDLLIVDEKVRLVMKNISSYELNFDPDEIMERFKRGDESRNTDGSGLGLAIAKDLVNIQGGTFDIEIDGDLFKVVLEFFIN